MEIERRVLLPLIFVITGTANVLLVKWVDNLQSICSDGQWRRFQHPVVQTAFMFLGEILCFIIYKSVYFFLDRRGDGSENLNILTRGGRDFSPKSMFIPAFLDTIATILLFTGLYLTYATSFQMIRGSVIIFVAIFSAIHLNQNLIARHWMAMFTIACGIITILSIDVQRVYYDKASLSHDDENAILTGNLLVICAEVFHGIQYVYEEKHLKGTDVPAMQAVGWQGIFGFLITLLMMVIMNFLPTPALPFGDNSHGVFDDINDVFIQLTHNPFILIAMCIFVLSSACYHFAALSIVKYSSTANRVLADGVRIAFIWWMALLLEWEYFNFISLMGFVILTMGTIAYRNAIFLEWYRSILVRMQFNRYSGMGVDSATEGDVAPRSRPADVI